MVPETPANNELSKEQLLAQVRTWVEDSFRSCFKPPERDVAIGHPLRAVYWVRRIDPEADINVVLAVQVHDIERAFPSPEYPLYPKSGYTQEEYQNYSRRHSLRSARVACRFLRKELGLPEEQIEDIRRLIQTHETGGDYRQNLVQAADSISFLEVNVPLFISLFPEIWSLEEIKAKIESTFNRIQIPRAKKIALPFYEDALRQMGGQLESRLKERLLGAEAEYNSLMEKYGNQSRVTAEEIDALRKVGDEILSLAELIKEV